ncbi:unnamed protein product [Spodoptera littoralis]|uniref:Peptidase S1 domain-containing protein n=1 Tax=Spodoptera littoralis TaxID=7109 RepID=A0A9P0I5Y2_SPOLI|nr:unnamed protein product [Spodoptera littoralis]CAH1640522.1 unnamed protein product [Spodoptera littoralis]
MSCTKNNILYFIILSILVQVRSLVEVPSEEVVEIVAVESSIRKVTNGIFSALRLEDVKHKTRIKEFSTIHNFFVTITLQDQTNLKEIAGLVKVDNVDNKTQHFITQVNEVLNEDNKSNETEDDVYVTTHIETFIKKLEYLKDKYGFANNYPSFNVNAQILQHLKEEVSKNRTQEEDDSDNNLLSDLEYWQPSGRRIYQGHREKITRFPFVASVLFFNKFQCGGSIIKSDLVITSASCLQLAWNNRFFRENPAFLSVQVGCELYEGGDENIPIQEVYFHPDYDPKNLRNNLAIMRLLRVLRFGKRVKKIKKINFDREASPLASNTDGITIIGWGAKTTSNIINSVWSNRLSYAVLDFYPLKECQDVYSKEFVTYKNFCAGFFSKGGGACNRDVGGPGVAYGTLVGVVSFGSPNCGAPDSPTVFTKLGYYKTWIEEIMEMKPRTSILKTTLRSTRHSYRVDHYMTTPASYSLEPVTMTKLKSEPYSITPMPIKSIDALRALDDNNLFKEFITTMFGSEEVKEYLDQYEYETDTDDEEKLDMEAQKVLDMIRINTGTSTVRTTPKISITGHQQATTEDDEDYKLGSIRMVTAIENFEKPDSSGSDDSNESQTPLPPKSFIDYTTSSKTQTPDSAEKVEEKIAKLIDEIDIQELLKSESGDTSADLVMKNKTVASSHVQMNKGVGKVPADDISGDGDDDDDDDVDNEDDDDDKAGSEGLYLDMLDLTHKVTEKSQKQPQKQPQQQSQKQPQKQIQKQPQNLHQQKRYKQKPYQQQPQHPQKQHCQNQNKNQQKHHKQQVHQPKSRQLKIHQQQQQKSSEQGLSIPSPTFRDFTFRQNESYSSGSILDIFSQTDLMELLTEVVADATKSNPSVSDNVSGVW